MKRLSILSLAGILALLAFYFIVAGTVVAWFGGSWYYLLAGLALALALSGVWVGHGDSRGRGPFAALSQTTKMRQLYFQNRFTVEPLGAIEERP